MPKYFSGRKVIRLWLDKNSLPVSNVKFFFPYRKKKKKKIFIFGLRTEQRKKCTVFCGVAIILIDTWSNEESFKKKMVFIP